jgi:tetratricopeptide (TPR) repeat protein
MSRFLRTAYLFLVIFAVAALIVSAATAIKEIPITTSSKEAAALNEKGQYLLDVGRPQEATDLFQKAVKLDPKFSTGHLNVALSSASAPDFKKGLDDAMQTIQGKSEGEKLLVEINRTFIDNDAKKRIELSEKLVKLYPSSPRAWVTLGTMQGTLNQNDAARQAIVKGLELDPNFLFGHIALGFNYVFGYPRDLKQAEIHMKKCTELAPKEAKCYENLGDVYRAMNKLQDAKAQYSKALQLDPALGVVSLKKGHINSFLGHYQEAFSDYDKGIATAKSSNKINYANYRAFTHVHAGEPAAAIQDLSKLVTSADTIGLTPQEAGAAKIFTLTNEAQIALHNNLFDQSAKILKQLETTQQDVGKLMKDPNFTRLQKAALVLLQGQLAARQGDYATAKSKAEENHKLMESDTNPRKFEGYYALLGLTSLLQKDYANAASNYKKADLTVIYNKYHYATALDYEGKKEEAKKLFKEVAEWNFNSADFALVRKDAIKRT